MNNLDIHRMVRGDQTVPHLVFAFTRQHSFGSAGIRVARPGAKWSHTATWDPKRQCFNEALFWKNRVVETPYEEFFANCSRVELVVAPADEPEAGLEWLRWHADNGTRYDYKGAHAAWLRGDWQNPNRLYCSEKETLAWKEAGHWAFYDTPRYGVHPHDLYRAMIRTPDRLPLWMPPEPEWALAA